MSDGVPGSRIGASAERVACHRNADGSLEAVSVVVRRGANRSIRWLTVEYEVVGDGCAILDRVVEQRGERGDEVALAGLNVDALGALGTAEDAAGNVPGVTRVQPAEDVFSERLSGADGA